MRKGQINPCKGVPRPHTWIMGPDELRRKQYYIWLQQRNQARYRGEDWTLTFDQWLAIWGKKWNKRGRKADNLCMSRKDPLKPWNVDNTYLINRREHIVKIRRERDLYTSLAAKRKAKKK